MQACSTTKRKKIGFIPVQSTAKSRRLFKLRGRRPAVPGRSRLDQRVTVQLSVGEDVDEEDGGITRHKLPSKKVKTGGAHSLSSSVAKNKRGTKKH